MAPSNNVNVSNLPISQRTFTLGHPSSAANPSGTSVGISARAARRVHIPAEVLKSAKIGANDPLLLAGALSANEVQKRLKIRDGESGDDGSKNDHSPVTVGFAWPSFTLDRNHVAAGPSFLADTALQQGDVVTLSPIPPNFMHDADAITVRILPLHTKTEKIDRKGKRKAKEDNEETLKELFEQVLNDLQCVMLGQTVEIATFDGSTRKGKISQVSINGRPAPKGVYVVCEVTEIHLEGLNDTTSSTSKSKRDELVPNIPGTPGLLGGYEAVGGLDRHISQIRELVELPLTRPELYNHFGLQPPRGILLHGPPGTGKTLLASSIAASLRLPLLNIDGPSLSSPYHGETEQRLREVFQEAQECAPSIIVIDEVDALVPAREDAGEVERRVVATLLTLMDGLGGKEGNTLRSQKDEDDEKSVAREKDGRVIVIACTNRPNAIDQALRRPGRFDKEIEIGVPDAEARLSILKVLLRRTPHRLEEQLLREIAEKTHGYVGADLSSLVHTAGLNAIKRLTTASNLETLPPSTETLSQGGTGERYLLPSDISTALSSTRPSALRSVFLETPQVAWSDIGGQSIVKQKLQEVIEWPLKYPDTFKRLGVKPPRGILLYGPPGCSKTLIARALASGAGVNFIAVKGPEIFNKYVGESERTIRETFRKARAASPCIIFLDEVDVIASSRDESGSGDSSDRILTTLLTEMDGIEELHGVTILAATNRPDVIDGALMRPGRLDRILYVAPPNDEARKEIFSVHFNKMAVHQEVDETSMQELVNLTQGCSGAEVVSICQDAAFNAMNENLDAANVRMHHFVQAAKNVRRRITPEIVEFYEEWKDSAGVREV